MKRAGAKARTCLLLAIFLLVSTVASVGESGTTWITVDGNPADWFNYEVIVTDPAGDHRDGGFDIASVHAFANNEFLYVMIETHGVREDYVQVDLEIKAAGRKFVVSFRPEEGWPASMGDVTSGLYQFLGEVSGSVSAAGEVVEFKMPLSALGDVATVTTSILQLLNVRPMGGNAAIREPGTALTVSAQHRWRRLMR